MSDTVAAFDAAGREPAVREQIEALGPWFHNLHLPGGVQTRPSTFMGGDFPNFKWQEIRPIPRGPARLARARRGLQRRLLQLRAGAARRLGAGIDVDEHYLAQARWAAQQLGLQDAQVEFRQHAGLRPRAHRMRASTSSGSWASSITCAIRCWRSTCWPQRTRRMMMFQTLTMPGDSVYGPDTGPPDHRPRAAAGKRLAAMAFIEHRLAGDPTNWWVPNHAGVEAMLRSSGLRVEARPGHEIYLCVPDAEARRGRAMFESQYAAATGAIGEGR
jgi:tRNA (mo5U34)-methyltransferase